ncbi:hypothetical protein HpMS107_60270 [Helicobacter pylori]
MGPRNEPRFLLHRPADLRRSAAGGAERHADLDGVAMSRAAINRNNRWLTRAALVALGYCLVYSVAQVLA